LDLTESFVVPAAVERVWELFDDVPEVVECMPGAQVTERVDENTYKAQLTIAVGPIRPKFDVRATIERDESAREGRINVDAVDKRGGSRARAQIVYRVSPQSDGAGTAVELEQHVTLSGPLAQFGRTGVIEDINAQMTRQFAECLAGKLGAPAPGAPGAASADGAPAQPRQEPTHAPAPDPPRAAATEISVVPLVARSMFGRLLKALRLRR
jgi:carbon monoxide dehydrogenase subunit G